MEKDKPVSAGEELFLVHLQRHSGVEPRAEDFDHETPHKPHHTSGEELWEVHLKRSQGLEPDYDKEDVANKEAVQQEIQKKDCPYNLRSRDSSKKSKQ
jgi:hypothetical protein